VLRPEIDFAVCQVCDPCEARPVCKTRAIVKIDTDEPPVIALERCSRCGLCVKACSYGAIALKMSTPTSGTACQGTDR
jgi:Fe-S-cluster-containing hydrogenase component 2